MKCSYLFIGKIKNSAVACVEDSDLIRQTDVKFFKSLLALQLLRLDASQVDYFFDFIPSLLTSEDNVSFLWPLRECR